MASSDPQPAAATSLRATRSSGTPSRDQRRAVTRSCPPRSLGARPTHPSARSNRSGQRKPRPRPLPRLWSRPSLGLPRKRRRNASKSWTWRGTDKLPRLRSRATSVATLTRDVERTAALEPDEPVKSRSKARRFAVLAAALICLSVVAFIVPASLLGSERTRDTTSAPNAAPDRPPTATVPPSVPSSGTDTTDAQAEGSDNAAATNDNRVEGNDKPTPTNAESVSPLATLDVTKFSAQWSENFGALAPSLVVSQQGPLPPDAEAATSEFERLSDGLAAGRVGGYTGVLTGPSGTRNARFRDAVHLFVERGSGCCVRSGAQLQRRRSGDERREHAHRTSSHHRAQSVRLPRTSGRGG